MLRHQEPRQFGLGGEGGDLRDDFRGAQLPPPGPSPSTEKERKRVDVYTRKYTLESILLKVPLSHAVSPLRVSADMLPRDIFP